MLLALFAGRNMKSRIALGFSAILRFFSPFEPSSQGGATITNNTAPFDNFAQVPSGVTTPVPEPGTALLLLADLAARHRGY